MRLRTIQIQQVCWPAHFLLEVSMMSLHVPSHPPLLRINFHHPDHPDQHVTFLKKASLHIRPAKAAKSYLIFVLISPQTKFLAQFFSTPKRVNSDKTDFATKQRKLHKREILQQNSIKCDKTTIIHYIAFTLRDHDRFFSTFIMWGTFHLTYLPHILHVEKFST